MRTWQILRTMRNGSFQTALFPNHYSSLEKFFPSAIEAIKGITQQKFDIMMPMAPDTAWIRQGHRMDMLSVDNHLL